MSVVVKGVKVVREDNFLMEDSGSISGDQEEQMYKYDSAKKEYYTVNQEECVEILKFGMSPDAHSEQVRFTDRELRMWNVFSTRSGEGKNTLPFNARRTFEEQMMDWGYTPYIAKTVPKGGALAPTLKLPEGDQCLVYQKADSTGISSGSKAVLLARRYMKGSSVDYKHFNTEEGGLESGKKFHNDDQGLDETVPNKYTQAWGYDFLKNEAFKFFNIGVYATSHLVSAKIMIDDPEKTYNYYFVSPTYNQLPYVDTVDIDASVSGTHYINEMPQLVPTIDTVKGRNKNLRIYVKDDGTKATDIRVRLIGVRYAD